MVNRQEYSSLRQGLVSAWCPSLGASGLTLIDRSGRGNHGTLVNMGGQDNWKASGSGVALNFDGTNDYATATASIVNSIVTMSLWAYFYSTPTNYPLLCQWQKPGSANYVDTVTMLHRPSGDVYGGGSGSRVMFSVTGATYNSSFPSVGLVIGRWNHFVGVFDGSTQFLFLNGVLAQSAAPSSSATIPAERRNVEIANNRALSSDGYFNGQMDDIRLYSRALTPAEIRLLASRRGIGLQPLPDRGGGLPRKLSVNVGGTWRDGDAYVNTGSGWRLGIPSVNVGGTWR